MRGPSEHLSWAELRCKDGTEYPHEWRNARAPRLAQAFEALRRLVGQPLVVLSGYRSPSWNRKIGGARHSQHMQGRALDLRPPDGWTVLELAAAARQIGEIAGLGVYPSFVHIDVRPGRRATWQGGRPQADEEA